MKKRYLFLLFLLGTFFTSDNNYVIRSDTHNLDDVRNLGDIYSPRYNKDTVLDNHKLKDIYIKEVIDKQNIKISAKIGTQLIINTNEKTKVWENNDFTKVVSSNLSPSQERLFNIGDEVDIYAIVKSTHPICKEQYNYVNGGVIKSNGREKETLPIYMNIFGEQDLRKEKSKDKITFKNKIVTFQEIDVRIRKSLMSDKKNKFI